MTSVEIYTDGSCRHNGKPNAIAAYGIFSDVDRRFNCSGPIEDPQTNQRAELLAACYGIQLAIKLKYKRVLIYVDSEYVEKAHKGRIAKYERNGWRNSKNNPVANEPELRWLKALSRKIRVEFMKIEREANKADRIAKAESQRLLRKPQYIDVGLVTRSTINMQ